MSVSFFEIIDSKYNSFSKSQIKIADYVKKNYDKVAYMSAKRISQELQISESTIVRFSQFLGYKGYLDFQNTLRENVKGILTTEQKIDQEYEDGSFEDIIKKSFLSDISIVRDTMINTDYEHLKDVAKKIISANKVYVLGLRSSKVLADYLSFYLNFFHSDVKPINHGASDIYEQILNLEKGDIAIFITLPRYSSRMIDYSKIIKEKEVDLVAITDVKYSPIVKYATDALYATYSLDSFIDSQVSAMSLLNALVMAIAYDNKEYAIKRLNKLEKIWSEYKVYL